MTAVPEPTRLPGTPLTSIAITSSTRPYGLPRAAARRGGRSSRVPDAGSPDVARSRGRHLSVRRVTSPMSRRSWGEAPLRMLTTGLTDEAAARRMGLSSRTYRRRVAETMRLLESESRFQAGVRAGSLGLSGSQAATRRPVLRILKLVSPAPQRTAPHRTATSKAKARQRRESVGGALGEPVSRHARPRDDLHGCRETAEIRPVGGLHEFRYPGGICGLHRPPGRHPAREPDRPPAQAIASQRAGSAWIRPVTEAAAPSAAAGPTARDVRTRTGAHDAETTWPASSRSTMGTRSGRPA